MGLKDLIVAIAQCCCVSRFPSLKQCWFMRQERRWWHELESVVLIKCMSREPYGYLLVLVRNPGPDAIILDKLAESEELRQSVLNQRNIECARDLPGEAAPSSQA